MTQLEVFQATVDHRKVEKPLFYADFTQDLLRRVRQFCDIPQGTGTRDFFGMFRPADVSPYEPSQAATRYDLLEPYYTGCSQYDPARVNCLGVLEVPGSLYHFTRIVSPLRNAEELSEIERYPFPTHEGCALVDLSAVVAAAHDQGKVVSCWSGHLYENSWQIRGYESFLVDMLLNPENCDFIFDRISEFNLETAVAAAKAGVDLLSTGDDVANQRDLMFSIEVWRRFIKPRWAKLYAEVKKINPRIKIRYHSDGNIMSIIPELIEIGVDILNPVQPECLDVREVKRKYGDKLVLDGAIGTQSVMPFGTPEDVRQAVRAARRDLGSDGALILAPTHVLEPEVPIENILAFVAACLED
ncbi:MAG TPA: hypothetical protein DD640_06800 [Clostridiales bacterium]|nr:hypothetical protein [Clostridiales bacterium]